MKKPHKGIRKRPLFFLLYGTSGTRKSSFCATIPKPIFIDIEGGLGSLDVESYDHHFEDNNYDAMCKTLDMLLEDSQGYKSVVIDSLDWVQQLVEKKITTEANVDDINLISWGNGTKRLKALSIDVLNKLLALNKRGMNVAVICHCDEKAVKAHDGRRYNKYDLLVHPKVSDVYRQRADMVLFAARKVIEVEEDGVKTQNMSKDPTLFTLDGAGFFAKNRFNLPLELPMKFDVLVSHVKKFYEAQESKTKETSKLSSEVFNENLRDK